MNIRDFFIFVGLGFCLGMMVTGLVASASKFNEAAHSASDCVFERWAEYEDRVGEIPSMSMEAEWRAECLGADRRAKK